MIRDLLYRRFRGGSILAVVIGVSATAHGHADETVASHTSSLALPNGAAERLAGAIRFPTISHANPEAVDKRAFAGLHDYLKQSFPLVHRKLAREVIADYSLLYKWEGSDPALRPMLLLAHLDVVPVEPGTETKWERAPFSGAIANGFVWGRGSIDNKSAVVGTLEAVEMLLAAGFQPRRTVYLAFGHDEEVGGQGGARLIAELLKSRGIRFDLVLDEGGVIGDGLLKGVAAQTALVGIAEKGFASVELTTTGSGGHSSLPPRESAIGILGAAVARLEERQMPARLEGPTRELFTRISPELPVVQRVMFRNLWLTKPMILGKLEESPTTNAMIRTTTAVTMFQAGTKENVLASNARAVINFRILPGDSIAGVVDHVRRTVADPRVDVRLAKSFTAEPSKITRTSSYGFEAVESTIKALNPRMIVAPYLVVVVTDARYYAPLSDNVLRFLPVRMQQTDLARMHGTNERLAIRDYEWAVRFYHQLIANVAGQPRM